MARLVCISGINRGREYPLPERGEITMGRSDKNDICVMDKKSSRHHCKVIIAEDGFKLQDLDSTNGLTLNSVFIKGIKNLSLGDRIGIGDTMFVLTEDPVAASSASVSSLAAAASASGSGGMLIPTSTSTVRRMKAQKEGKDTGFLSVFELNLEK